jgi:hypothetical protein
MPEEMPEETPDETPPPDDFGLPASDADLEALLRRFDAPKPPLTDAGLEAIRARHQAVSPAGPWQVSHSDPTDWSVWHCELGLCVASKRCVRSPEGDVGLRREDALFIAHAWQDVGDLLAEVAWLRQRVRELGGG